MTIRSLARYISLIAVASVIGVVVCFALDGFEWKGFGANVPNVVGSVAAGLAVYYLMGRDKP